MTIPITNVLFVCGRNNRSYVAEEIMRQMAQSKGYIDLNISSVGIRKPDDEGLLGEMWASLLVALGRYKLDDERGKDYNLPVLYTPRQVTRELLLEQNLVLCMSHLQVEEVLGYASGLEERVQLEGRVYPLSEYAGFKYEEVVDPHKIIGENLLNLVPLFLIRHTVPYQFRGPFYDRLGVDPGDEGRVMRVHEEIVKQIGQYVDGALGRMLDEGLISVSKPTPDLSGLLS